MEPPAKRQRLSPPIQQRPLHESSSDDDDFYAPAPLIEQPKPFQAPEETDYDVEVEILDEGEEVEEVNEADLHIRRAQSLNKIRTKWDEICEKYGRQFEHADEIDLNTLEVVVDNGHISQMQDETDVGNGQPTPRRVSCRIEYKEGQGDDTMMRTQKRRHEATERSPERRIHRDHRSPRRESRSPQKSNLRRRLGTEKHKAKEVIYEDESSDDEFLYEKAAPSTVVLAHRQPQAMNQIEERQGSRTVVEKRTVITTKRITTIRADKSQRTGSRDENHGRHTSHERRSKEVQRYTKSSQEKVVETSSDDELVQRDPAPLRIRSPSLDGKDSLWAPKRKVGRPRIHHHGERSERHIRPSPRRAKREVRYDENGRKIRKPRNDRGKMRVPEHLRKTRFVNKYVGQDLESKSTMFDAPSLSSESHPQWRLADFSASIPAAASEEDPKSSPAKPIVFARNKVNKEYDFSDKEDDALPQNRPSLLTACSANTFLGQDTPYQLEQNLQPKADETSHNHFAKNLDTTMTFQGPHSPPPPYSEFEYHPSPLDSYNMNTEDDHFAAPMANMASIAHMETLHQFLPLEGESFFMDSCLSLPPTSPGYQSDLHSNLDVGVDMGPLEAAQIAEPSKYESENDLSIPIDPALLALDAENRAASLERAEAAMDPTNAPEMQGTPVPTLPFEELGNLDDAEDDSDDDLFASEAQPRSFFDEAVAAKESDDDDDLEDFLILMQPAPVILDANESSSVEESPIDDGLPTLDEAHLSPTEVFEVKILDMKSDMTDHSNGEAEDDVHGGKTSNNMALSSQTAPCTLPTSTEPEALGLVIDDLPADTPSTITEVSSVVAVANDYITSRDYEEADDPLFITTIAPEIERTLAHVASDKQQSEATVVYKEPSPIPAAAFSRRTEVPYSDADSEDELLTQPSSQPPPRANLPSSQPSLAQAPPRKLAAIKKVRFADTVVENKVAALWELPPPTWSPLTDEEDVSSQRPSSSSCQADISNYAAEVVQDDEEDDIALLPDSPVRKPKTGVKAVSAAPTATSRPSEPTPWAAPPVSKSAAPLSARPKQKQNNEGELAAPKSILKRPSRSTTPQPHPANLTSRSKPTPRATPPRLFSLSVSPQSSSQSKPRPKLRASLLSESASTTSRRTPTPTPAPATQISSTSGRRPSPRLLSASPVPYSIHPTMKGSRSEMQARARGQMDGANDEEAEVVEPGFRRSASEESRGRSTSAEMPELDRRCGQRGFRCQRTICFKCKG